MTTSKEAHVNITITIYHWESVQEIRAIAGKPRNAVVNNAIDTECAGSCLLRGS